MIPGFRDAVAQVNGQRIAYSAGGEGPPLLLLHGFPQTRALWSDIASRLAGRYHVVAADLRGYGGSSKPPAVTDYSFREMARDQVALMAHLGVDRFHVAGHDRGGRTAHRMALDHPAAVASLQVMDIVPTHRLLDPLDRRVAQSYYHWFFLAQPEPFPERMIAADPDAFFESCLLGWGAARLEDFDPAQLAAYRAAWRDPDTIRGMCNDYRAALEVDFDLDAADLGRRIACPTLVLYGADGAMAKAFDVPATWADRCTDTEAEGIPGGHFFPDTAPDETAAAMLAFLSRQTL
ncbi:alpha/beta hydrolase [Oceanicola sp. 22II-s10i]|uniref:alpha/beta fold hydrolase n=1 Tax=Oceanicola sp. 22II-s10i TaxID=1317116 RepID=UPI000B5229CD|nr:alpha/beta hydrolase [Oceanicola sp. 22II-s10i]OWU83395.1 alpha/beta hydrolase [Oceanicola sp. 22II-s10i]